MMLVMKLLEPQLQGQQSPLLARKLTGIFDSPDNGIRLENTPIFETAAGELIHDIIVQMRLIPLVQGNRKTHFVTTIENG